MKIHVTSRNGNGSDYFAYLSIVENDEGRYYVIHHSLPFDPNKMFDGECTKVMPLNPIGIQELAIDAMHKFNSSKNSDLQSFVAGYMACKGMIDFSIFHGGN